MSRPNPRQYRWDNRTTERLEKLGELLPTKSETEILSDAIGNFLSLLERDERPWLTVPSEVLPAGRRSHKRPDHIG